MGLRKAGDIIKPTNLYSRLFTTLLHLFDLGFDALSGGEYVRLYSLSPSPGNRERAMWEFLYIHFLLNKFNPPIHRKHSFATVLLQEDRTNEFVNWR
jgi:hypothetical protein